MRTCRFPAAINVRARRRGAVAFAMPFAVAAALGAQRVGADVIVVHNLNSSGAGSLFDAICQADKSTDTNVQIQFNSSLSGCISLDEVTLTRSMTITGLGSAVTILGAKADTGALITVAAGVDSVQLSSLAISARGGIGIANYSALSLSGTSVFDCGSYGIDAEAQLSLFDSKVTCNSTGGIYADGKLSVFKSDVSSNGGYGIEAYGDPVDVHGSTLDANSSGGIFSMAKTLTVDGSSASHNGGSGVQALKDVKITGGSVLNCNDGEGLLARNSVNVQDSTFAGNQGYGIELDVGSSGTVARSTMNGNHADGLRSSGVDVTAVNDTLAFNLGGGFRIDDGTTTLLNDTIARNVENGVANRSGGSGTVTLENTLAALNGNADLTGSFDNGGNNLLGTYDPSGCFHTSGTALPGYEPSTVGLSDKLTKDGMTSVLALLSGSKAIDGANTADAPPTDQRGQLRPQPAGGPADIGAYEYEPTGQPGVGTTAPLPATAWMGLGLLAGAGAWGRWSSRLRRRAMVRA